MAENGIPEEVVELPGLPRWVKLTLGVIVFGQAVAGTVLGIVEHYADAVTQPLAGCTFCDHEEKEDSIGFTGRSKWQYEIKNPGPGTIEGYKLKIAVDDKCDEAKNCFLGELSIKRVGASDYKLREDGGQTIILVSPLNAGHVAAQGQFGVLLTARLPSWKPATVKLVTPHNDEVDAAEAMPRPSTASGSLVLVRNAAPWLVLLSAVATVVTFLWMSYGFRRAAITRDREAEARGYNKALKDNNLGGIQNAQQESRRAMGAMDESPASTPMGQPHGPFLLTDKTQSSESSSRPG